jgi:hypothetical protein
MNEELPTAKAKARWEQPLLTPLGDLKDLVRGAGKVSGQHDEDSVDPRNQLEKPNA